MYDPYHVDAEGIMNIDKMLNGNFPIGYDGVRITIIHHFDQKHKGAWVVLPDRFHRKNHGVLHSKPNPIDGVNRSAYGKERNEFWINQAQMIVEEKIGFSNK